MKGLFITFEGTEGSGKSSQIQIAAQRLQQLGLPICVLREPGGTPIGEEIRHTLKHSPHNSAMTPETELLLLNASRAQLVREVIQPALDQGQIVLCDRFADSSIAYQGFGRCLNIHTVKDLIDFAIGNTRPDLTLLLLVPVHVSEIRRTKRSPDSSAKRDRFEEADQQFFLRVEQGYEFIARSEPDRVQRIDATQPLQTVAQHVWRAIESLLAKRGIHPSVPPSGT